ECSFVRMIDERRIVALETEFDTGIESLRGVLGNGAHAVFDQVQILQIESTYGADQGCIISDDIRRTTGMNLRDREYGSIQRIAIATDDGLPALGYLHCSHHRIKPLVRLSGMTTFAFDDDFKFVARCHHGAGSHAELSGLHAGPIVHAE